jgi:ribonuclease HII
MTARLDPTLIPPAPDLSLEQALWKNDSALVAGLDEAGRGAWAGPVTAAVVILSSEKSISTEFNRIRDSKQLRPECRAELEPLIKTQALDWGIGFSSSKEIDELGISPATRLAMIRSLINLKNTPDHLLIDALFLPEIPIPQTALIKGDQRSLSIAAASILAKTARDRWMVDYSKEMGAYSFERNKGYGTKAHQVALQRCGPCPQHRFYYTPIKSLITKQKTGEG